MVLDSDISLKFINMNLFMELLYETAKYGAALPPG